MFKDMNSVWTASQPPQLYDSKLPQIQEISEGSNQSEDEKKEPAADQDKSDHVDAEVPYCMLASPILLCDPSLTLKYSS